VHRIGGWLVVVGSLVSWPGLGNAIPELDLAAMIADMRPPSDDDVPVALDGTRLDTPEKLIAYLKEINSRRQASDQRAPLTRSTLSASCVPSPSTAPTA
jgi:hypothetical protein